MLQADGRGGREGGGGGEGGRWERTRLRKERNSAVEDLREIEAMLHESENERTALKKQLKQMSRSTKESSKEQQQLSEKEHEEEILRLTGAFCARNVHRMFEFVPKGTYHR